MLITAYTLELFDVRILVIVNSLISERFGDTFAS
jgi:hypothetical protein